jgi:hypothetical protein
MDETFVPVLYSKEIGRVHVTGLKWGRSYKHSTSYLSCKNKDLILYKT